MNAFSVRLAQATDAAEIAAVNLRSARAAYRGLMSDAFLDGIDLGAWETQWATVLSADEQPLVLVAVRDERVVGLCRAATPGRDTDLGDLYAEFTAVYVDPDEWRSGIGRALMERALDILSQQHWQGASLWVADGNTRAIAFYQQLGFTLDGSRTMHEASGVAELRMRTPLSG